MQKKDNDRNKSCGASNRNDLELYLNHLYITQVIYLIFTDEMKVRGRQCYKLVYYKQIIDNEWPNEKSLSWKSTAGF